MGARYYEPKSGRFLSPDPLGHDASLSLYDYCNGDPVNGLDPDGRCVEKGRVAINNANENAGYIINQALYFSPDFKTEMSTLKGISLGFLDLNIFDSPNALSTGSINYSINGINTSDLEAEEMSQIVADRLNVRDITPIANPSHGIIFDLIRAFGQLQGITDITSLRAADVFNASGPGNINVVAFSNGTELVAGAMPYVFPSIRARMNVQSLGGQVFIDQNKYGLHSAVNRRILSDPIPYLTPTNWRHSYQIINIGSFKWNHPFQSHAFKNNYAPYIAPTL
jgi:hypothetical protein